MSHVHHVSGLEAAEVEARQAGAASEHISHVRHVVGLEAAEVEARQVGAVIEHICHVRHVVGLKVLHACDGGQRRAIPEPIGGAGGAVAGKRGINDSGSCAAIWGRAITTMSVVNVNTSPTFILTVVVECDRKSIVAKHSIRLYLSHMERFDANHSTLISRITFTA